MAIELKQSVKQSQQLMMSPQVQQAIKILALGRLELEEFIVEELRENPCLEEVEEGDVPTELHEVAETPITGEAPQDLSELRELLREPQSMSSLADTDSLNDSPVYENVQLPDTDLHDELSRQLSMRSLEPEELEAAMLLLEYIDDNGFLGCTLQEVAENHSVALDVLEAALCCVQSCEPIGVGARSVQECLLLQLPQYKKAPMHTEAILKDYWAEFEKQDVSKIAKALKLPVEKVKAVFVFVRDNLDPRPARQFGDTPSQIIIPDVFIFKRAGEWVVSLNEDGLPRLKVSQQYASLLKKKDNKSAAGKEAREFVNQRMKNAGWIINAISERNKTILRVAEVILKKQMEFFEKGKEYLRPLTLKQVAEELGLHESTISRTTSNKYLHSPRGIFELKFFFNAGMGSESGEALANEVIRNWVAEFVKSETPGEALSDQEIAGLIEKEKNVKIARRTVAKYREALGILPSSKRNAKF